jgi:hypothetical protein
VSAGFSGHSSLSPDRPKTHPRRRGQAHEGRLAEAPIREVSDLGKSCSRDEDRVGWKQGQQQHNRLGTGEKHRMTLGMDQACERPGELLIQSRKGGNESSRIPSSHKQATGPGTDCRPPFSVRTQESSRATIASMGGTRRKARESTSSGLEMNRLHRSRETIRPLGLVVLRTFTGGE